MKVLTVLGTRPELIRLSRVIPRLDEHCDHVLVHTGQNFDDRLSAIFFRDLGIRAPNHSLGIQAASFGEQVGRLFTEVSRVLEAEKPDRVLVLGDTNSGLSLFLAKRAGIPTFHLEAGNRCYDDRVPEEVNRRVIDQSSDVLMPYTERSRANLLREGFASDRVFVVGNPINEVLHHFASQIDTSKIAVQLKVQPSNYFLVTLHRAENVDDASRLPRFVEILETLAKRHKLPVVVSVHPRLRSRLEQARITITNPSLQLVEPLGFFDFVWLEKHARCVLSDSGTVQEECCIFNVPNVTLRDVTERPETVECGSNILAGADPETALRAVDLALDRGGKWLPPPEYLAENVSDRVLRILLGYRR